MVLLCRAIFHHKWHTACRWSSPPWHAGRPVSLLACVSEVTAKLVIVPGSPPPTSHHHQATADDDAVSFIESIAGIETAVAAFDGDRFYCPHCNVKYTKAKYLKTHMKHCGQTFHCVLCRRDYKQKRTWVLHMRTKHPEEQSAVANVKDLEECFEQQLWRSGVGAWRPTDADRILSR